MKPRVQGRDVIRASGDMQRNCLKETPAPGHLLTSPPAQHTPISPTSTGPLPMLLRLLIGCQTPLQDNPASPSNFRPIALTPTVSKLLSGILRDRWLRYMRDNNYLDPNIQRAVLPTVPGVSEHQAKLATIVKSAKRMKRSLAVAWLDIANAHHQQLTSRLPAPTLYGGALALLKAKLPKCCTMCFQASTGRKIDHSLLMGK